MLQAITSSRRTFLCFEALDECTEEYRPDVLDSLRRILEVSPSVRVFLTGMPQIKGEIEKRFAGRTATLFITPDRDDIIRYLRAKLDKDTTIGPMNSDLEADIMRFLPVPLNIEAILQEPTIYRRRERLREMTNGLSLGDAYGATLQRIKAQRGEKARLGIATLMWVSHSERPLQVDELCYALTIEIGAIDPNTENTPSIVKV